jgi:two-component system, chemotaxis family, chemotaxis protein CheY
MLEMCNYEMPDCVIVTSTLPDMEAHDAIAALRRLPDGKKPKILLMTVELNVGRIMRAKRAGADGYILKPFNRELLMDALKSVSPPQVQETEAA